MINYAVIYAWLGLHKIRGLFCFLVTMRLLRDMLGSGADFWPNLPQSWFNDKSVKTSKNANSKICVIFGSHLGNGRHIEKLHDGSIAYLIQ